MPKAGDDHKFVPPGYKIVSKLGSGQTSHVYLAEHAVFGKVALKLPRPELSVRPVLKRMFENEVAITVKLAHRNVVAAFDGFPTGDGAFLALEYCGGGTLDQHLLERGRLPLKRSYELIVQVADGLSHTHSRKVLHRDVKPANVFLTDQGEAKLGDFGTGVFMGEDSEARVGTAFYMAPEVFEGRSAGVLSDIYSLGILAYEAIAGERPFVGTSYDALMVAHHTEVPRDIRRLRPDISNQIVSVVSKAMSRDPQKRYTSADQFALAIRRAADMDEAGEAEAAKAKAAPTTGRSSRTGAKGGDQNGAAGKPRGLFGWFRRGK
ncbi:MAG: serine/threonine-protein kinase [Trueperaceae bacterium]